MKWIRRQIDEDGPCLLRPACHNQWNRDSSGPVDCERMKQWHVSRIPSYLGRFYLFIGSAKRVPRNKGIGGGTRDLIWQR